MDVPPPHPVIWDWYEAAVAGGLGLIGRLMYLSDERRRPVSWSMAWELPVGVACGWCGFGLAQLLNAHGWIQFTIAIGVGLAGPRWVSWAISVGARRLAVMANIPTDPPPPPPTEG